MFEIQSPKTWQAQVNMVTTLEQMQVPNGTVSNHNKKFFLKFTLNGIKVSFLLTIAYYSILAQPNFSGNG